MRFQGSVEESIQKYEMLVRHEIANGDDAAKRAGALVLQVIAPVLRALEVERELLHKATDPTTHERDADAVSAYFRVVVTLLSTITTQAAFGLHSAHEPGECEGCDMSRIDAIMMMAQMMAQGSIDSFDPEKVKEEQKGALQ